jgi:hypothetical protein
MIPPSVVLAIAAGIAGAAGGIGATRTYYLGQIARAEVERREAADTQAESARLAGRAYEAQRATNQRNAASAAREIEHAVSENHAWGNSPVPDGVRHVLEQAAGAVGASEPGGAVPPVRVAPAADERSPR